MKHYYFIFLFLCNATLYGQVNAYLEDYRLSGNSDYKTEELLLSQPERLYFQLLPFLEDSLPQIRQKAYSLLYREGQLVSSENRIPYIMALLEGCKDSHGSIVGQSLIWLQGFDKRDFSIESKALIADLLRSNRMQHRQRLVMLAGYVGVGGELMKRRLLQADLNPHDRWYFSLALARLGDESSVEFCLETLREMELNNHLVEFVLPDIIYTRQKKLFDLCVEYIQSDEKSCFSADPDSEISLLCGYRILELMAPVIMDFPIHVNAIGGLEVQDYEEALLRARKWFIENPDYLINDENF